MSSSFSIDYLGKINQDYHLKLADSGDTKIGRLGEREVSVVGVETTSEDENVAVRESLFRELSSTNGTEEFVASLRQKLGIGAGDKATQSKPLLAREAVDIVSYARSQAGNAEKLLDEALWAVRSNMPEGVMRMVTKTIKENPGDPDVALFLGSYGKGKGDFLALRRVFCLATCKCSKDQAPWSKYDLAFMRGFSGGNFSASETREAEMERKGENTAEKQILADKEKSVSSPLPLESKENSPMENQTGVTIPLKRKDANRSFQKPDSGPKISKGVDANAKTQRIPFGLFANPNEKNSMGRLDAENGAPNTVGVPSQKKTRKEFSRTQKLPPIDFKQLNLQMNPSKKTLKTNEGEGTKGASPDTTPKTSGNKDAFEFEQALAQKVPVGNDKNETVVSNFTFDHVVNALGIENAKGFSSVKAARNTSELKRAIVKLFIQENQDLIRDKIAEICSYDKTSNLAEIEKLEKFMDAKINPDNEEVFLGKMIQRLDELMFKGELDGNKVVGLLYDTAYSEYEARLKEEDLLTKLPKYAALSLGGKAHPLNDDDGTHLPKNFVKGGFARQPTGKNSTCYFLSVVNTLMRNEQGVSMLNAIFANKPNGPWIFPNGMTVAENEANAHQGAYTMLEKVVYEGIRKTTDGKQAKQRIGPIGVQDSALFVADLFELGFEQCAINDSRSDTALERLQTFTKLAATLEKNGYAVCRFGNNDEGRNVGGHYQGIVACYWNGDDDYGFVQVDSLADGPYTKVNMAKEDKQYQIMLLPQKP